MDNRRDQIFGAMVAAARARARRRGFRRLAVVAIPLVAVAVVVGRGVNSSHSPAGGAQVASRDVDPRASTTRLQPVEIVRTVPGVVSVVATSADTPVRVIDDQELLRTLQEAGFASGLVRTGERVFVTGLKSLEDPGASEPDRHSGV